MKAISTVIIGAGQAGLAMSKCLSDRSVPHVVLERAEVANAWANDRWDSLRLLTPNWQSRLPGDSYSGPDPDGFMDAGEVTTRLRSYAHRIAAPVEERTQVLSVTPSAGGYRVATSRGDWSARNIVLATGACARANVPEFAEQVPARITQLTPYSYKSPDQAPPGGVLVVGASATGVQLASELLAAGHEVTLATGEHIRVPRRYRGRDIQWWMDRSGLMDTRFDEVDDIARARRVPSLQLIGQHDPCFFDLNALRARGATITGRLAGIRDGRALFSGALANHGALSDLKMNRLLYSFDTWATATGQTGLSAPQGFGPTDLPPNPHLTCRLDDGRIRTILWATGYRPDFSWLRLPVFDARQRLSHHGGIVAPGIYALGLPFLRRRKSALIDGVGDDAQDLADHLVAESRIAA